MLRRMKGPLEIQLSIHYPPGGRQRKRHNWRMVAPTAWDLARFLLPILEGIVFEHCGQVARLTVEKTYAERPQTTITVGPLFQGS